MVCLIIVDNNLGVSYNQDMKTNERRHAIRQMKRTITSMERTSRAIVDGKIYAPQDVTASLRDSMDRLRWVVARLGVES